MNQNEILSSLLAAGNNSIRWVDSSMPSFDPETDSLEIPFIKQDVHDVGQLGWILTNVCQLITHNQQLWARCKQLGIPKQIYSFVNQIRSERELKKIYPGSVACIQKFWVWLRKYPDFSVNPDDGFIKKYLIYDKLSVYDVISTFSTFMRYIVHGLDEMKSDEDFIYVCVELMKHGDVSDFELHNNDMQYKQQRKSVTALGCGMDDIMGIIANRLVKKPARPYTVKKHNPFLYAKNITENHFVNIREVLKLHETQMINEFIGDRRIVCHVADFRKKALALGAEFAQRKSALIKSQTRDTDFGEINHEKLWSYELDNNIMLTDEVLAQGESHGLIIMLDLSASMIGPSLKAALEQVLILALFARSEGIKYRIVGMGCDDQNKISVPLVGDGYITPTPGLFIWEFFNDTMSEHEFNKMMYILVLMYLTSYKAGRIITELRFSKTPLLNSLIYSSHLVSELRSRHDLQKVALMFISDGKSDPLTYVDNGKLHERNQSEISDIMIFNEGNLMFYHESEGDILRMTKDSDPMTMIYSIVPVGDGKEIEAVITNPPTTEKIDIDFNDNGVASFSDDLYDKRVFIRDKSSSAGLITTKYKSFHNELKVRSYPETLTKIFIHDFA